jgi:ABC-2 type transport system permease protein
MSTGYTLRDSATMLRRNLLHIRRYPSLSIKMVAQPVLYLLLLVYVFGATM